MCGHVWERQTERVTGSERETEGREHMPENSVGSFEDGWRRAWDKEHKQPLKPKICKEMDSSLEHPEER